MTLETNSSHSNAEASRRRFLGRSIVVGGVAGAAWVTPTIFSADAAAAGTDPECCPIEPVDFLAVPFGGGTDVWSHPTSFTTFAGPDVWFKLYPDLEQDTITGVDCTGGFTHGIITDCTLGGISTGQIPLVRRADAEDQDLAIEITFSPPVSRLKFTLTNIDEKLYPPFNYQNALVLTAWDDTNGTYVDPVLTLGPALEIVGNELKVIKVIDGQGEADPMSSDWNLEVAFGCDAQIDVVTIEVWNWGDGGTSSTEGRVVGFADMQFCLP